MPVTLPRVSKRERRVLSGKASFLEMRTPFTLFLDRRNKGTCCISSLRDTGSCDSPEGILRLNSSSGEDRAAKAPSTKIKVSRLR